MSSFGETLRGAVLAADSPDGGIHITARGDGTLDVTIDERAFNQYTESTLAQQVEQAVARLLQANRRMYVEAWRSNDDERGPS